MSACGKHGGPFWFHCPKCRGGANTIHVIALVQRYRTKSPVRQSLNRYRYECACGHIGTSRHMDVERKREAQRQEHL